jgi:hypothetical protein
MSKMSLCEAWERLQHNPNDEDALEFAAELVRAVHKPTQEIEASADHLYDRLPPSTDPGEIWDTAQRLQSEGWRAPTPAPTTPPPTCTMRTRRGRSRERHPGARTRRSSARSGDSGPDDSDPEPPAGKRWSWAQFVASFADHAIGNEFAGTTGHQDGESDPWPGGFTFRVFDELVSTALPGHIRRRLFDALPAPWQGQAWDALAAASKREAGR